MSREPAKGPAVSPPVRHPIWNVLSNWGGFAVAAVVGLALAPFVVHTLGDTQYGVWTLLTSLVGYLGLLDLGIRGAVTRYVANLHAAGRHDEAGAITSTALTLFSMAGLLAVIVAGALAWVAPMFLTLPPDLVGVARVVFILGGVSVAASLIGGVFGGIVVGLQRFDLVNAIGVTSNLLRAALIVGALNAGMGLIGLAVIQMLVNVLQGVAQYAFSKRVYPGLRVELGHWSRQHVGHIVSFGVFATLLNASVALMTYSDSIVIGAFMPVSAITFFAIAASLIEYTRQVVSGISHTVTPLMGSLQAQAGPDRLQRVLLRAARITSLVMLPILLTLLFRGTTFIKLWMGEAYIGRTDYVLFILAIGMAAYGPYQVLTSAAMGVNAHRGLVPAFLLEAGINVGLSILLVREYGIIGVALGTLIPRLVACFGYGSWYAHRLTGVHPITFLTQSWLVPILAMVPFALVSTGVDRLIPPTNLFVYFLQVAAALPIAAAGAWLVALNTEERLMANAWLLAPWRALLHRVRGTAL